MVVTWVRCLSAVNRLRYWTKMEKYSVMCTKGFRKNWDFNDYSSFFLPCRYKWQKKHPTSNLFPVQANLCWPYRLWTVFFGLWPATCDNLNNVIFYVVLLPAGLWKVMTGLPSSHPGCISFLNQSRPNAAPPHANMAHCQQNLLRAWHRNISASWSQKQSRLHMQVKKLVLSTVSQFRCSADVLQEPARFSLIAQMLSETEWQYVKLSLHCSRVEIHYLVCQPLLFFKSLFRGDFY